MNAEQVDGQQLVRDLLRGSENIDRMRREIYQLVAAVIGFLRGYPGFKEREVVASRFATKDGFWEVVAGTRGCQGSGDDYWRIQVELCGPHPDYKEPFPFFRQIEREPFDKTWINLHQVQAVYESLPILVAGLIGHFPKLAEKWEPLVKASKVKFD